MTADDLPAVLAIAALAHPKLPEREEIFAEKLRLYPAGCRTLALIPEAERAETSADGISALVGYFFSHPWYADEIPALDTPLETVPALTDTYYLHDLALHPSVRRTGYGPCVVRFADELARRKGYTRQALVAVNQSEAFWRRQGFEWVLRPALVDQLARYGEDARLMVRLTGS